MPDSPRGARVTRLVFYTTSGCHLCEQAAELLEDMGQLQRIEVSAVDISTDEALVALYGIRIPVVKNQVTGKELGWPFGLEELLGLGSN